MGATGAASHPDGGCRAWTMVLASFMVSFLQDGFRDSFGLLLPSLAHHFSCGRAAASLTSSIMTLLTLGSGPLAAAMVAKIGHRLTTLIGVLLASTGLATAGLYIELVPLESSPHIAVIYLTVGGMVGLGFGLMYLPAMDIVTHYFSRRLGLATGLAAAGSGVGQVVLAPCLHLATSSLGLATTLHCLAATVAGAAVFGLLYRLPGDQGAAYRVISPQASRRPSVEEGEVTPPEKSSILTSSLLILLVSHFFFNMGIFAGFSFTTDRAVQGGLSPTHSSLLLSVMGVANCLGRVIFGIILDQFRAHALLLTVTAMATNSLALLTSILFPSLLGQLCFSAMFGATFGCYISSVVVILSLHCSQVTPSLGLTLLTAGLSSLAGPTTVGLLFDTTLSYMPGFLGVGVLSLGAALLPLLLLRGKERAS